MPIVSAPWSNKFRTLFGTTPTFANSNDANCVKKRPGLAKFLPLCCKIESLNSNKPAIVFRRIDAHVLRGAASQEFGPMLEFHIVDKQYNILVRPRRSEYPIEALRRMGSSKVPIKVVALYDGLTGSGSHARRVSQLIIYKFPDKREPVSWATARVAIAANEAAEKSLAASAQFEAALAAKERF